MNRITKIFLIALAAIFVFSGTYAAEKPVLMTGEQILQKYVKATGGEAAHKEIKNMVVNATFSMPAMGLNANMKVYTERPNKMYTIMESEALGKIESGTDGNTVWDNSSMTGPSIKTGAERESVLLNSSLDNYTDWQKYYSSLEYIGTENVDGKPCYKLLMKTKDSIDITSYIETATDLIIRMDMIMETQMGKITMESYLSDYKTVSGIKIAHKTVNKVMGQEIHTVFNSVEINTTLPEGIFDIPAEVKALMNK